MPPIQLRKRQKRSSWCLVSTLPRRSTTRVVFFGACLTAYLVLFWTNVVRISVEDGSVRGSQSKLSRACWLHDSERRTFETEKRGVGNNPGVSDSIPSDSFRILCTSTRKKMHWGSYQLRCRDLKDWALKCATSAQVVTDVSFEDLQRRRWLRYALGLLANEEKTPYNATIFVKSFPGKGKILPLYGDMFVDLVDEYKYIDKDIPEEMQLILQTEWQGKELFQGHKHSVVEHWYNSYPADMALSGPPEYVPPISPHSNIGIATVWNTKRSKDPTEGGCPKLTSTDVTYECLDRPFDISTWYLDLFHDEKDKCEMERTLADANLGPGMLYYNLFRKYDALVVLAKNDTMKLKYGNVQRAVSQMRSGVPVLIEIRGEVLKDFVKRYNYTCAFQRHFDDDDDSMMESGKFPSFDEAVALLRRPEIREACQTQGLAIARDYTPSRIAQKFLRTVGYGGDFTC